MQQKPRRDGRKSLVKEEWRYRMEKWRMEGKSLGGSTWARYRMTRSEKYVGYWLWIIVVWILNCQRFVGKMMRTKPCIVQWKDGMRGRWSMPWNPSLYRLGKTHNNNWWRHWLNCSKKMWGHFEQRYWSREHFSFVLFFFARISDVATNLLVAMHTYFLSVTKHFDANKWRYLTMCLFTSCRRYPLINIKHEITNAWFWHEDNVFNPYGIMTFHVFFTDCYLFQYLALERFHYSNKCHELFTLHGLQPFIIISARQCIFLVALQLSKIWASQTIIAQQDRPNSYHVDKNIIVFQ